MLQDLVLVGLMVITNQPFYNPFKMGTHQSRSHMQPLPLGSHSLSGCSVGCNITSLPMQEGLREFRIGRLGPGEGYTDGWEGGPHTRIVFDCRGNPRYQKASCGCGR